MTRFSTKRMTPETVVKTGIKNWLKGEEWMGKLTWWHNLAGLGVYPGLPDIFVLKSGQLYGLEVKSEKGRESENQAEFGEKLKRFGAHYAVVRDWREVEALLTPKV